MGLFQKTRAAKASYGKEYAKEGRYWVRIDRAKFDKHTLKGTEFIAFETRVVHVLDCPKLANGEPSIKPGEPFNFVFMDGVLGNEARLKAWLLVAAGEPNKPIDDTPDAISEDDMRTLVDQTIQPLKDTILEVNSAPQLTRSNKTIVGSRAVRQVDPNELLNIIDHKTKAELYPGNALEEQAKGTAPGIALAHGQKMDVLNTARRIAS